MKEKKPVNMEIGRRIRRQREAAGLTQETFAELVGLGVKHISAIERGAVGVSIATVQTICRVLSISSDAILMDTPQMHDAAALAERLARLPERQYRIAEAVLNQLLEAFVLPRPEE